MSSTNQVCNALIVLFALVSALLKPALAEDNVLISGTMRASACTLALGDGTSSDIDFGSIVTNSLYRSPFSSQVMELEIALNDCDVGLKGSENYVTTYLKGKESLAYPGYLATDQDESGSGVAFKLYGYLTPTDKVWAKINKKWSKAQITECWSDHVTSSFGIQMFATPNAILGRTLKPGVVSATLTIEADYT